MLVLYNQNNMHESSPYYSLLRACVVLINHFVCLMRENKYMYHVEW